MAGWTGLEPATFCVTGRRSNQLSYHPVNGTKGYIPGDIRAGQEGIPPWTLPEHRAEDPCGPGPDFGFAAARR